MPSGNNHATSVFFADRTALQIARSAQNARRVLPKSSIRTLPRKAPLREEVLGAIAATEREFPGLHLDLPVQVLVGAGARCWEGGECVSRCCSAELSRGSFCRVASGVYVCTPALVLGMGRLLEGIGHCFARTGL